MVAKMTTLPVNTSAQAPQAICQGQHELIRQQMVQHQTSEA